LTIVAKADGKGYVGAYHCLLALKLTAKDILAHTIACWR